jgi:hypothetical protein
MLRPSRSVGSLLGIDSKVRPSLRNPVKRL